jgi:hypothetical protein
VCIWCEVFFSLGTLTVFAVIFTPKSQPFILHDW